MSRKHTITRTRKRRSRRTAAASDKHELYELSVQEPEAECDFIDQVWKERRRRLARHIREDFCGTALTAIEWVKRRKTNTAIGVDIDASVLAWAKAKLPERLDNEQRRRLTLRRADVRRVRTPAVDCVLAMNFSYYTFKTRDEMRRYFRRVRLALAKDGLFLLDAYGGSDAFLEIQEKRQVKGFTYVWDQSLYNPVTGEAINYIHFRFPDETELCKAFTYDWRLWTLPELRELLAEAGFAKVTVYWEGTDEETGEGDDEFRPSARGEACPGWIAYLVAQE
ncbi:MAG: class I SAM-dependent methyltransferase [Planctomycetes bacterium]|nr:class I SAM-dependent methyltransferase [Planctomycetota bacterium]